MFGSETRVHWTPLKSTPWSFMTDLVRMSDAVFLAVIAIRRPLRSLTVFTGEFGTVTIALLFALTDVPSATSWRSAVPVLLATKNGV